MQVHINDSSEQYFLTVLCSDYEGFEIEDVELTKAILWSERLGQSIEITDPKTLEWMCQELIDEEIGNRATRIHNTIRQQFHYGSDESSFSVEVLTCSHHAHHRESTPE